MRWKKAKVLVSALLTNNMVLPDDEEESLALLEYALQEVANRATTLRLLTTNVDNRIAKHTDIEGVFMRLPALPVNDEEELDIDEQLCFAVARFMASFIVDSPTLVMLHESKAIDIINQYNSTIEAYQERQGKNGRENTVLREY